MTTDYIAIENWLRSCRSARYVRKYSHYSRNNFILYVIDNQGALIDSVDLRLFICIICKTTVSTLLDDKFTALNVNDDQENAIIVFQRYGLEVLPVVDNKEILLGIVTADDILDLMQDENTEDMQKVGGLEALDGPYMETPFFELMQKRAGWLVILFIGEMLTATALGFYQKEIEKAVVLTLFFTSNYLKWRKFWFTSF